MEVSGDNRRRRAHGGWWLGWLAVAVIIGLSVLIFGHTVLPRTYFGSALDPSAANVVPWWSGFGPATLETGAPRNSFTPGIEGSVLFVRLVDEGGQTILDRPFQWPADSQAIPPGRYALTAYWRVCDGNCSLLDAEGDFCHADVVAAPGGAVRLKVVPRDLMPGTTCTVSDAT